MKKLTLSVEIHPNFGGLFPASSTPSLGYFEFFSKDDPSTVLVEKLRQGVVLRTKGEFVFKEKQKNLEKEFFLDIAPGKNCFFIFCLHAGIYKKLLDDSRPTCIYRFKSADYPRRFEAQPSLLKTSSDRRLMFMNKKDKVYSIMNLDGDRIQSMVDNRFSKITPSGYEYTLSPGDVKFLGKDTLMILFRKYRDYVQRVGLVKYGVGNRKVLFKNIVSLPENTQFEQLQPCPKDRYLCSYSRIQGETQIDHWVEVYELTPRLDAIKVVARCLAVNYKTNAFKMARIIDYIGKDQRYGLIFGIFSHKKNRSLNFFVYLFDTIEKKVLPVIENGEILEKGFDLNGVTQVCQNKLFLLKMNFDFLKFELTGADQ